MCSDLPLSLGLRFRNPVEPFASLQRRARLPDALATQPRRVQGNARDAPLDAVRGVLHLWIGELYHGHPCILDP